MKQGHKVDCDVSGFLVKTPHFPRLLALECYTFFSLLMKFIRIMKLTYSLSG